jgi:hypothetical protein
VCKTFVLALFLHPTRKPAARLLKSSEFLQDQDAVNAQRGIAMSTCENARTFRSLYNKFHTDCRPFSSHYRQLR